MSRTLGSLLRAAAVWLVVSAASTTAAAAAPPTWTAARSAAGSHAVGELVVAICTTALALALAWLWLVTTTTVLGLLHGRAMTGGATRRLVLLACGVAVAAGSSVPALAAGGDGRELLAGLALPERAVAPPPARRPTVEPTTRSSTGDAYVVRPGDSLSSIALARPGSGSLEERWRAIWRANRDVVGDDPDLILPGQSLRLPRTTSGTTPSTQQDGDRS